MDNEKGKPVEFRKVQHILELLSKPSKLTVSRTRIDDFMERPRVLMVSLTHHFKLFFRPWPFYFFLGFPTRRKLAKNYLDWLMTGKAPSLWIKPFIRVGKV